MKIEKENVKRYAVYTFHDKDGIVDECVITFLKELKKDPYIISDIEILISSC